MNAAAFTNLENVRGAVLNYGYYWRIHGRCTAENIRTNVNHTVKKRTTSVTTNGRILRCKCSAELSTLIPEVAQKEQPVSAKEPPPTYVSAPGRIIAIGDLHGDLKKTIRALELAQVVTLDDNGMPIWCGGNATLVQLGDVLDRGDCEIGILMLLRELGHQAAKEGGAVYMINGNHESLNVCGNFRYVTRGAFYESALAAGLTSDLALNWDDQLKARLDLYSPGGLVANELAKNPTVLVVNDTIFAHGGLLPIHVNYGLERINREMSAWMRGDTTENGVKATPPYIAMGGPNSILWNRTLAQERFDTPYEKYYACSLIKSVLKKVKAKRLVVGHTPQMSGCNSECGGQIWRVDIGMSEGVMNAEPQVISIEKDDSGSTIVKILHSSKTASISRMASSPPSCSSIPVNLEENNIQSAVIFESITFQSHRRNYTSISKTLISKLNMEL